MKLHIAFFGRTKSGIIFIAKKFSNLAHLLTRTFMPAKADIVAQLQRNILSLQGLKPTSAPSVDALGLEHIRHSFPNSVFPFAAVHEFFCTGREEETASLGFVSGILSSLLQKGGVALWICSSQKIFPPALKAFGIPPHQVIFLILKTQKDVSWAIEEALTCKAVAAVVGELQEFSFTLSRRFQLVIEQSGVACFLLRPHAKKSVTSAVTRWHIKPLNSRLDEGMPGVGYPRWRVNLLKVRNGKTGSWEVEWARGKFQQPCKLAVIQQEHKKKTG